MLPSSLLMELYDQQITNEDFERMLIIPDGGDFTYDPYKPIKSFSFPSSSFRTVPPPAITSPSTILQDAVAEENDENVSSLTSNISDDVQSSSSTEPATSTESVSYWQDLEIYSTSSSDEENRPTSNLSWTSLDNNKQCFKNNARNYGRYKSYDVKSKYCSFCFHNREKENVYTSHALRDDANNITCPALFEVVCRYCGATGTEAHTPKYCPNRKQKEDLLTYLKK